MEGEVRAHLPVPDDGIYNPSGIPAKHLPLPERKVVGQESVEQAGHIGNTSSVVAFGVVGILEEERTVGLAGRPGKSLFIAKLPEVAQSVGQTFRPGVVRLVLKPVPFALGDRELQGVVPLNTAGVVEADGGRIAGAAAVDQRLRKRTW